MWPELAWQAAWARLGWGVVLAALALGLARRRPAPAGVGAVLLACLGVMWLPGPASPAYWLGLAMQSPSGLLVACCGVSLWGRCRPGAGLLAMPRQLAWLLLLAGGSLYLDTGGWLSFGLYARGMDPALAPGVAIALSALALACVVANAQPAAACAVLLALTAYALARLPTGNLWDALLDPLLWGWAVTTSVRTARSARA